MWLKQHVSTSASCAPLAGTDKKDDPVRKITRPGRTLNGPNVFDAFEAPDRRSAEARIDLFETDLQFSRNSARVWLRGIHRQHCREKEK
jgi:hypothetical protein